MLIAIVIGRIAMMKQFKSKDLLKNHVWTCHLEALVDEAPIERQYMCDWLSCTRMFRKKHLLENHIVEHIVSESNLLFINLLNAMASFCFKICVCNCIPDHIHYIHI